MSGYVTLGDVSSTPAEIVVAAGRAALDRARATFNAAVVTESMIGMSDPSVIHAYWTIKTNAEETAQAFSEDLMKKFGKPPYRWTANGTETDAQAVFAGMNKLASDASGKLSISRDVQQIVQDLEAGWFEQRGGADDMMNTYNSAMDTGESLLAAGKSTAEAARTLAQKAAEYARNVPPPSAAAGIGIGTVALAALALYFLFGKR